MEQTTCTQLRGETENARKIFGRLPARFTVAPVFSDTPVVPCSVSPRSFKESRYQKRYLMSHSTTTRSVAVDETDVIAKLNSIQKMQQLPNDIGKKKKSLKRVRDKREEAELSSDESFGENEEGAIFDNLDDLDNGDGTTIVPYIDTLPAGLRDRERELHVHHSEVPEAWGPLFAAITEGSLPRVMRLWDRGVFTTFCSFA
jgi:hypothetical protein